LINCNFVIGLIVSLGALALGIASIFIKDKRTKLMMAINGLCFSILIAILSVVVDCSK
jgi:hypothetical protein